MPSPILSQLRRLQFPGEAGRLQAAGDTSGLVLELGGSYAEYHAFLANRLEQLGGDPDPDHYRGRFEEYCRASADVMDVLVAETFLRQAVNAVQFGRSLGELPPDPPPLADEHQRLISAETGTAQQSMRGIPARAQVPCPFPVD